MAHIGQDPGLCGVGGFGLGLGFQKGLVGQDALGHIPADPKNGQEAHLVLVQAEIGLKPHPASILGARQGGDLSASVGILDHLAHGAQNILALILGEHQAQVGSDQLVGRVPQDLEACGRNIETPAVLIRAGDDVRDIGHQGFIAGQGVAQPQLLLLG